MNKTALPPPGQRVHRQTNQSATGHYGKTIFDTYQKRINELLVRLETDFTITGLTGKTDDRANESYSDFGFLILQQTAPLTARQDDVPCFKNTLSEGDKSTLAFAFFIVALEKMSALDKQIIVFDDPLSSLDGTRGEATAILLLELSPKVNHLNVFTHKKDFVFMRCDKMPCRAIFGRLSRRSPRQNTTGPLRWTLRPSTAWPHY